MLIAGEASGDLHASRLISAIKRLDPQAEFRFFGGDLMAKAAGCRPDLHYDRMNASGTPAALTTLALSEHFSLSFISAAETHL